jgi:glucose/arabinose dehydrogenase
MNVSRSMLNTRRSAFGVAALVSTILLAACGSDSSSSSDTTTSETVVETTTTVLELSAPDALTATQIMKARQPVAVVERDATDGFFYVVEKQGYVSRYSPDGTKLSDALDMTARTKSSGERGLLGLAFRTEDNATWYAYVNYSDREGTNSYIDEYTMDSAGDFIKDSRRTVMTIPQPYTNHNGGDLKVGPDNMLYIAMGDGGSGNDPERVAMKLTSVLGKILRIDPAPTATTRNSDTYNIPADNPFVSATDSRGNPARGEIWAIGLRNPWRIHFDESGALWIADVGQNKWEEISMSAPSGSDPVGGKGANYGWSAFEGTHVLNPEMSAENHTPPVFEYSHDDGRCSISGGVAVNPAVIPSLNGWYLFSDYCDGKIAGIQMRNGSVVDSRTFTDSLGSIVAVQQMSTGVYALNIEGPVYRLLAS